MSLIVLQDRTKWFVVYWVATLVPANGCLWWSSPRPWDQLYRPVRLVLCLN